MTLLYYLDELEWVIAKDKERPGDFLQAVLNAAQHADAANYELLRPVIRALMAKYPAWNPA